MVPVVLITGATPSKSKRSRIEELWKEMIEDIRDRQDDSVRMDLYFEEETGEYKVVYHFNSNDTMFEYSQQNPVHKRAVEIAKDEKILEAEECRKFEHLLSTDK